ncbi:MAG TPA: condensation domain-containing protein, partial [Chitinophaga sp.]|uniref:non-ribosomal peptide synthetase n=1 Tax=Chitinophaga sp. TaxID=1869181 RepID=UPI002BC83137
MSNFNLIDIVELINKANDVGIRITLDDDRLKIKVRKDQTVDSSLLDELKLKKEHLIAYFRKHGAAILANADPIRPAPRNGDMRLPLSSSQERLWFIDQLEGSTQYHIPTVLRLRGRLQVSALDAALGAIVDRHEVLRTVIAGEDGKAYQEVKPRGGWKLNVVDDSIFRKDERALRVGIREQIEAPFNLSTDYMLRATLFVLDAEEYVLTVVMHHIASDGWSGGIIVKELVEFYDAVTEGREATLPPLDIQYADFAVWQREQFTSPAMQQHMEYWKQKLGGVAALHLPADYQRPAVLSADGAISHFSIDKELTVVLHALSRRYDATLFMTLLTAFKVLLYRYTGQDDICVGTPSAGRNRQEVEGLVGFFVNTLALRSDLTGNPSFETLLLQVKDTTLGAYQHQDVPLEKIVDAVSKERDLSRNPLFQVVFALLNLPEAPALKLKDLTLLPEKVELTKAQFDLTLTLFEGKDGLSGAIEYSTDLYQEETIARMITHYVQLLKAIVAEPSAAVSGLQLLTNAEEALLQTFNTATEYKETTTIPEVFATQVESTPDKTAIVYEGQSLTYRTLDEQANQLAHYLHIKGVSTGTLVPLFLGRSLELMIAVLGILKAGGAYVPVDPEYPADRISFMLSDTAASLIIADSNSKHKLPQLADHVQVIVLDDDWPEINAHAKNPVNTILTAESLAYIIYTSGSTGRPKGVLVSHRNVVSLVKNVTYVSLSAADILLSTGSPSFDATTFEYWGMLLNGGTLILCPEHRLLDSGLLKEEMRRHGVTKMWFTASWFNQLIDTDISIFEGLSAVLAGGEKLSDEHVNKLRRTYPALSVINGYGPTENTTFSLTFHVDDRGIIPIGRPLDNRAAYVLDVQLRL